MLKKQKPQPRPLAAVIEAKDSEPESSDACETEIHNRIALEYVWLDWEHCDEADVISESVQMKRLLEQAATRIK